MKRYSIGLLYGLGEIKLHMRTSLPLVFKDIDLMTMLKGNKRQYSG